MGGFGYIIGLSGKVFIALIVFINSVRPGDVYQVKDDLVITGSTNDIWQLKSSQKVIFWVSERTQSPWPQGWF